MSLSQEKLLRFPKIYFFFLFQVFSEYKKYKKTEVLFKKNCKIAFDYSNKNFQDFSRFLMFFKFVLEKIYRTFL